MVPFGLRDAFPDHEIEGGFVGGEIRPWALVVDGNPEMLEVLKVYLEQRRFRVVAVETLAQARICFVGHRSWALVISEYDLPDGSGREFCSWMHARGGGVPPVLLMSGGLGRRPGDVAVLGKPFSVEELERYLTHVLGVPPRS